MVCIDSQWKLSQNVTFDIIIKCQQEIFVMLNFNNNTEIVGKYKTLPKLLYNSENRIKMTTNLCFICNVRTDDWLKLNEIKSQHTNTRIIDLLKKILGDCDIKRPIDSEINCICSDCLNRIDEYEFLNITLKKHEKQLYDIFQKTETFYLDKSTESQTHSKTKHSSIDLLPEVEAGRGDSFQFRSTTIRKITVGVEKNRESNVNSNDIIEIEDDSSEYECDVDVDELLPSKILTRSSLKETEIPKTSTHLKSSRQMCTNNDDFEAENEEDLSRPINKQIQRGMYKCVECGKSIAKKLDFIVNY